MPRVTFTPHLERFLDTTPVAVSGETVATALADVFAGNPRLRSYLLDDHGHLRRHVNIFVDGKLVQDRAGLSDAVPPGAEIFILQALSGGSHSIAQERAPRRSEAPAPTRTRRTAPPPHRAKNARWGPRSGDPAPSPTRRTASDSASGPD